MNAKTSDDHQNSSDDYETLTTQEAAHYYRVSERTILRWIDIGKLSATRDGNRWIIRHDIDAVRQPSDTSPTAETRALIEQLRSEINFLQTVIEEKDRQIDQLHQLLGRHAANAAHLTAQLEDMRAKQKPRSFLQWLLDRRRDGGR